LAEVERWIYTMGLLAYFEEGKRPQYSEAVAREIDLPEVQAMGPKRASS
jgi:hypothetical protein